MIVASQHSIGECSSMCVCLLWARVRARAFFFCIISRTICAHRFNKLLRAHTTTIRPTHWQLYCVLGSSIVFVWSAQMDISFRYYILVESQKFRVFGAKRHRTRTALVYLWVRICEACAQFVCVLGSSPKENLPAFLFAPVVLPHFDRLRQKIRRKKETKAKSKCRPNNCWNNLPLSCVRASLSFWCFVSIVVCWLLSVVVRYIDGLA